MFCLWWRASGVCRAARSHFFCRFKVTIRVLRTARISLCRIGFFRSNFVAVVPEAQVKHVWLVAHRQVRDEMKYCPLENMLWCMGGRCWPHSPVQFTTIPECCNVHLCIFFVQAPIKIGISIKFLLQIAQHSHVISKIHSNHHNPITCCLLNWLHRHAYQLSASLATSNLIKNQFKMSQSVIWTSMF